MGVHSAVNGWKRMQAQKAETEKIHRILDERRRRREEEREAYDAGAEVDEDYYWPEEGRRSRYEERHVR